MIPTHPFELRILYRDGKHQTKMFDTIATAIEAAKSLRPALVSGYSIHLIIDRVSFDIGIRRDWNSHKRVEVRRI